MRSLESIPQDNLIAPAANAIAADGARAAAVQTQRALQAPILMAASAVAFGLMAVALRLAVAQVSAFEAAFFRSLFGLLFSLPLLYAPGLALMRTHNFRLYLMRGLFGTLAMLTGFWAIAHLPLAQAVTIGYSAPLFVTIGAVLTLGEVVHVRRWSAVIAGFVGVLIIMRPGAGGFSPHMLVALASAALSAGSYISIKFLSRTEPPDAVVIYMNIIIAPLTLIPALWYWTWPDLIGWGWLVLTGLFGTLGQTCMTRAYQLGDVSALVPLNFVQLPVVVVCAWILFDQKLDLATVLGAALIIAANIYIARREARLAAAARAEPAGNA
jgi:drug/metabolite transporter (DMT)-like permease